jgi:hypothetical protein
MARIVIGALQESIPLDDEDVTIITGQENNRVSSSFTSSIIRPSGAVPLYLRLWIFKSISSIVSILAATTTTTTPRG